MALASHSIADWEADHRAKCERQIERNNRFLRLAEHNGFVIELRDYAEHSYGGTHLWFVPVPLQAIVGNMAVVVRL